MNQSGVVKKDYHDQRQKRIDYNYRLNRRTREVRRVIEKQFDNHSNLKCLDIGTADGLMLSKINQIFKFNQAVGIDMSEELIKTNLDPTIKLEVGDAQDLKFQDNYFDIVIAASMIDHLDDPEKMIKESYRVLKDNGILILTVANPWFDKLSEAVGYTKAAEHNEKLPLVKLKKMLKSGNFAVIEAKYFMLFPFFKIPFESFFEGLLNILGLKKLMCNQLIVGKK